MEGLVLGIDRYNVPLQLLGGKFFKKLILREKQKYTLH